jgi:4a-hydroxytetrahydrobiopterin dehydratase
MSKKQVPYWEHKNNSINRTITFKNFIEALDAMNIIGAIAEEMNHHPNWYNCYNKLEIKLFTHDAGEVTKLDYTLAEQINKVLANQYGL